MFISTPYNSMGSYPLPNFYIYVTEVNVYSTVLVSLKIVLQQSVRDRPFNF